MGYVDFFKVLGTYRHLLTRQELQTLRGQAMAGDYEAATKGLRRILLRAGRDKGASKAKPTV